MCCGSWGRSDEDPPPPPVFSLQTPVVTCWWPYSPWAARARSEACSFPARSTQWLSHLTTCFLENTKVRTEGRVSWPSHTAVFLNFLKSDSQTASQLYTFTCLTLLCLLMLNIHCFLALGDNALMEALQTNCHLIRTTHTFVLFWEGAVIHAILLLNSGKRG